MSASRDVVDQDPAGGGHVHLGEQLDEGRLAGAVLAHHRDHGPRGQSQVDVLEHQPVAGTRVGEGDAVEADAGLQPGGRRQVAGALERRVVLQPGQPSRAVEPDTPQEADLADRGADVPRQPTTGGQHQQHLAHGGVEPVGDPDDREDEADPEDGPRHGVPQGAGPADLRRRARTRTPRPYAGPSRSARPAPARGARAPTARWWPAGSSARRDAGAGPPPPGPGARRRAASPRSAPSGARRARAVPASSGSTSAARWSPPAGGSSRRSRTPTCRGGRARRSGRAARRAGRGSRAAPGGRRSPPAPGARRRGPPARWSPGRGSGAGAGRR